MVILGWGIGRSLTCFAWGDVCVQNLEVELVDA
jgi:hypothetical protein